MPTGRSLARNSIASALATSLMPQRFHRFDLHGPSSGQPTGECAGHDHHEANPRERDRIVGLTPWSRLPSSCEVPSAATPPTSVPTAVNTSPRRSMSSNTGDGALPTPSATRSRVCVATRQSSSLRPSPRPASSKLDRRRHPQQPVAGRSRASTSSMYSLHDASQPGAVDRIASRTFDITVAVNSRLTLPPRFSWFGELPKGTWPAKTMGSTQANGVRSHGVDIWCTKGAFSLSELAIRGYWLVSEWRDRTLCVITTRAVRRCASPCARTRGGIHEGLERTRGSLGPTGTSSG